MLSTLDMISGRLKRRAPIFSMASVLTSGWGVHLNMKCLIVSGGAMSN